MSTLETYKPSQSVKTSSASDPLAAAGSVDDQHLNETTGEIFTKVDAVTWRGTQGTSIVYTPLDPILATDHPNLVAMYTMDNINGATLNDESPNGNNGTITGAVQANGVISNSLSFDGVDDNVVVTGVNSTLGSFDFCISLWVNINSYGTFAPLFERGSVSSVGNYYGLTFRVRTSGEIVFYKGDGTPLSEVKTSTGLVSLGQWNHIVVNCVQSTGATEIFLNGTSVVTGNTELNIVYLAGWDDGNPEIGGTARQQSQEYANALFDQFRLFNRTLTPTEVEALHQEGISEITAFDNPSLLAAYTMDNITGATLVDESLNANNGTITGATQVAGQIGQALETAGTDIVNIPNLGSSNLTSGAVCFWVYYVPATTASYALSFADTGSDSAYANFNGNISGWQDGTPALQLSVDGVTKRDIHGATTAYISNAWNFAVIQSTGSAYEIWVNGIPQGITVRQGSNDGLFLDSLSNNSCDIFRMNRLTVAYAPAGTKYDQLRLFDRHLSPAEINELYVEGAGSIAAFTHPSLVAAYTGDNINGATVVDESPNGNDGTAVGTVTYPAGHIGNAIETAVNGRVEIPDLWSASTSDTPWSISAWVDNTKEWYLLRGSSGSNWSIILESKNVTGLYLNYTSGAQTIGVNENNARASTGVSHVVANFEGLGGNMELFVNGVSVGSVAIVSLTYRAYPGVSSLCGRALASSPADWVDEFRFFDRALSPIEIQELYNNGVGV